MARVNIAIEFDLGDESQLADIMDAVFLAVSDVTGDSPALGLQVDGEYRDPDDPEAYFFS